MVRGIPNLPKIGGGYSRVVYVFENFIKNFVEIVRFVIIVKSLNCYSPFVSNFKLKLSFLDILFKLGSYLKLNLNL
mgnify:CR=1 FL=1